MGKIAQVIGILIVFLLSSQAGAEEITIVGTGSGPPIIEAIGRAFTAQHPGISIAVPRSIGSGGGIKAVGNDEYLVARVARELKDDERHYNLTYIPIARVPIVFYAGNDVKISSLTREQILGIYGGSIFNWAEVGGHNARIRVVRRQDGDSSLDVLLRSFPQFKDIAITPFSRTTYSDPDTIELVERTPDAIAFGTYSDVLHRPLTVFAIDGISPADPRYAYYGTLALVFKEENRTGSLKEFIDFATSAAASRAITQSGGLPVR